MFIHTLYSYHRLQLKIHLLVRSSGCGKKTIPRHWLSKLTPHRKSKLVSICVLQKKICLVRTFLNQGKTCVPVVGKDGPVVVHHIDSSSAGTGQYKIFYPFLSEYKHIPLLLSCIQWYYTQKSFSNRSQLTCTQLLSYVESASWHTVTLSQQPALFKVWWSLAVCNCNTYNVTLIPYNVANKKDRLHITPHNYTSLPK